MSSNFRLALIKPSAIKGELSGVGRERRAGGIEGKEGEEKIGKAIYYVFKL